MRARSWPRVLCAWLMLPACASSIDPNVEPRSAGASNTPAGARAPGASADTGAPGTGPNTPAAPEPDADCSTRPLGARILRRLSGAEYDLSVADVLGGEARAHEAFTADTRVNGFDGNAAALTVSPLLASQLYATAERLASEAVQNFDRWRPCDPSANTPSCVALTLRSLGKRLYRRPLNDAELLRYTRLYEIGSESADFAAGLELVLTAMLQAPGMLYRSELGKRASDGRYALDAYELATELAYNLTGSTPDQALLEAAERDQLGSPQQLQDQARRLVQTPRGQRQFERFIVQWLEIDRLASVPKDATTYPEFTADIRLRMHSELQHFVAEVAFGQAGGDLAALLTSPRVFADATLAQFYGIAAPTRPGADGFGAVTVAEPQRSGVLTLGAVMTTHARPDSSSPVHRGKLVRERVMCEHLAPPPPGIVVQPPPVDPTLSVRERYAAHSQLQPCQGCHVRIDPIGFGFEHFDGIGRHRQLDANQPVDARGAIAGATERQFDGSAELNELLAGDPQVTRCFALQWFRFSAGVREDGALRCTAEEQQQAFVNAGGDLRELLVASTQLDYFRYRRADDSSSDDAPAPPAPAAPPPPGAPDPVVPRPDPPAMPTNEIVVTPREDSRWASGYCESVEVQNTSTAAVEWSVERSLEGTLSDHWNSMAEGTSGQVVFRGAEWNRSLPAGASTQFGYCVRL